MPKKQDQKPPQKNRYRKIEVRMWGDEKFRALSPMPPSAQCLWVFLLTGPHTGPVPGLFRSGRAAMAEELGWELEAFDEAFNEVSRQGMAEGDWKAKVVWIPNAIRCNRPESPNVVLSWAAEWDLIPECDLKRRAYEVLKANICALGEAFEKAFTRAFAKPCGNATEKPCAKPSGNQQQEQQQEQEQGKGHEGAPAQEAEAEPIRRKRSAIGLLSYLHACKQSGVKPVPETDTVFAYIEQVGIPLEFLRLHWLEFKARYCEPGAKRYKDWPAVHRKSVRGNWFKLWFIAPDGHAALTTVGEQARRLHGDAA